MKTKFPVLLLLAAIGAGAIWFVKPHPAGMVSAVEPGRKVLYYTCSMHPWVREKQPGPCPVCGMNLTPVFENQGVGGAAETSSNSSPGLVTLESESISVVNVQTCPISFGTCHIALRFCRSTTNYCPAT